MKLPRYQQDALLVLRTRLDPRNPANTSTAEIKAHLTAIQPWLDSWVLPAVNAMASGNAYSERWIREAVTSWAAQIRLGEGRGASSPDENEDPRMAEVRKLMRQHAKGVHGGPRVKAVKLYREIHGCGLKEAVDACDALIAEERK